MEVVFGALVSKGVDLLVDAAKTFFTNDNSKSPKRHREENELDMSPEPPAKKTYHQEYECGAGGSWTVETTAVSWQRKTIRQNLAGSNDLNFPVRSGGSECSYYAKYGNCKFGQACKFNHLPPAISRTISATKLGKSNSLKFPIRSDKRMCNYGKVGNCKFGQSCKFDHAPETLAVTTMPNFPVRPGMPECNHYAKYGSCKFGQDCKYNHVVTAIIPKNPKPTRQEFPVQPGKPMCNHYSKFGTCKFGQSCKYNHGQQVAVPTIPWGSSKIVKYV